MVRFASRSAMSARSRSGASLIVLQIIAALVFLGYTLTKKSIRLPFAAEPYAVEVEFADAKGLDRVDEPGAAVAGALVGRVTETALRGRPGDRDADAGARDARQGLRRRERRAASRRARSRT